MPPSKSPNTGFGLTTLSSIAAREARLAKAYGEDRKGPASPPTSNRQTTKTKAIPPAPKPLRLTLGEDAGTVRGLHVSNRNRVGTALAPGRESFGGTSTSKNQHQGDANDPPTITIRVVDPVTEKKRVFRRNLIATLLASTYFREHLGGQIDDAVMAEVNRTLLDNSDGGGDDSEKGTGARTRPARDNTDVFSRQRNKNAEAGRKKKHVEITVHCDVLVFGVLLQHIDGNALPNSATTPGPGDLTRTPNAPPPFTVRSVVPILVASSFLGIDFVVERAISWIAKNLPAVRSLAPSVGVENLGEHMLLRLAERVSHDTLEHTLGVMASARRESETASASTSTSHDACTSLLYKHKLPDLVKSVSGGVSRCTACQRIYPTRARDTLVCANAPASLSFHGDVVARHVPVDRFDAQEFVQNLADAHDPRHVFWYVWGATHTLPGCSRCRARGVLASELEGCRYHPRGVVLASRGATRVTPDAGKRACCGARACRFDACDAMLGRGCCVREHAIDGVGEDARTLATTRRRRALVVEPFFGERGSGETVAARNSVYLSGDHRADVLLREVNLANVALHSKFHLECDEDCDAESSLDENVTGDETARGARKKVKSRRQPTWPRGAFARAPTRTRPADGSQSDPGSDSDSGSASDVLSDDSDVSPGELPGSVTAATQTLSERALAATQRAGPSDVSDMRGHARFLSRHIARAAPTFVSGRIGTGSTGAHRVLRGRAASAAAGTTRAPKSSRGGGGNKPPKPKLPKPPPEAFGLPKEAYDALPEKLRRSLRRNALREADAQAIAELEQELRGMRRV